MVEKLQYHKIKPFMIMFFCIVFFAPAASAELVLKAVYPTLGIKDRNLDVTLMGAEFDKSTRISMYLDSGNRRSIVGSMGTTGSAKDIKISGVYAFVAAGSGGLRVIDISSPSVPVEIGFVETSDEAYGVAIAGNYAYVADGPDGGLQVIDISTPSAPVIVGSVPNPGNSFFVFI